MSRLIDADKLMEDVRENSESYFADDFAEQWVNRQQTVDAISIDWIKEYVARLEQIGYWSDVRAIESMVIEWKDEQENASRRG